jgi:hypothetical protein
MTTDTDKLIQVAEAAGFRVVRFNDADAYACDDEGKDITPQLAAFASAHIASLCGDVEQDGFHLVSVNAGFTELLEALDRADRKGYMPDAIYSAYEGFECRDPASTVAALKAERDAALARVAVLEKDAARYRWLRQEHERFDPICHLTWKAGGNRNSSEWVNTAVLDSSIDAALTKGQT